VGVCRQGRTLRNPHGQGGRHGIPSAFSVSRRSDHPLRLCGSNCPAPENHMAGSRQPGSL
ncbi:MAG: hypothetical protein, partial [Olavius algarvensis Gamma 1 endosymbiont]